jgi:hypothetical protein
MSGSLIVVPQDGHSIVTDGTTVDQQPKDDKSDGHKDEPASQEPVKIVGSGGRRPPIIFTGLVAPKLHGVELGTLDLDGLLAELTTKPHAYDGRSILLRAQHKGPLEIKPLAEAVEKLSQETEVILFLDRIDE